MIKSGYDDKCLAFTNGQKHPERQDWGYNNAFCGYPEGKDGLFRDRRTNGAVWWFEALPSYPGVVMIRSRIYQPSSHKDRHQCLIFGEKGHQKHPTRYVWDYSHDTRWCGFASERALYLNRQATWSIEHLQSGFASGWWDVVSSSAGGPVSYEYSVSVTNSLGEEQTNVNSTEVTNTIDAGFQFKFASGGVSVSRSTARSVSTTTGTTISTTSSETFTTGCVFDPDRGNWVGLYRWVVSAAGFRVNSNFFRCHYTAGSHQAPECPYGFCHNNNPLCVAARCLPWAA